VTPCVVREPLLYLWNVTCDVYVEWCDLGCKGVGLKSFVVSIDYRDYMGSSSKIWAFRRLFLYLCSYNLVGSVTATMGKPAPLTVLCLVIASHRVVQAWQEGARRQGRTTRGGGGGSHCHRWRVECWEEHEGGAKEDTLNIRCSIKCWYFISQVQHDQTQAWYLLCPTKHRHKQCNRDQYSPTKKYQIAFTCARIVYSA
jgi:hypothetical protein